MKKSALLMSCLTLVILMNLRAAEVEPPALQKFWGKIASVDVQKKNLTVHNRKKNKDLTFAWDGTTKITFRQQSMASGDLQVGQFLMVAFLPEKDGNRAFEIAVKPEPFTKSVKSSLPAKSSHP